MQAYSPLRDDLLRLTGALLQTQQEFGTLFTAKTAALRELRQEELVGISTVEEELTSRMQGLLRQRKNLLERAGGLGLKTNTLVKLAGAIGNDDGGALVSQLRTVERNATKLRQESWIHWIISHRCYRHYSELLELIAHRGQQAPTYSERSSKPGGTSAGAVLDASI